LDDIFLLTGLNMIIKKLKHLLIGVASSLLLVPLASAHVIAFGDVNAGSPGSVTFWLGSYHGWTNEGSLTIDGTTKAFDLFQGNGGIPTGLIAGTNMFYATDSCCNSPAGSFNNTLNGTGQTLNAWQGVTFSGLSAGTFTYNISGMNSASWKDWSSNTNNWTGQVTISDATVESVPEPGSLALIFLGLAGIVSTRKVRAKLGA
jgi:hypothetical protein